ncbi:Ca-activated chloride channel family protein [Cyclonatronum proteinivorum]|uniref:Ca-activated chloride channel family protein n=1 Tax=Cyclonatronum proteinivorum TaxID=1457365 RepID=A0A345UKJ6_9BACT|nr:VWA domain-containing protein [Cyclonatronum proteinivorum]AXJ00998.1 Ca-activated chloride channel family protein [Cyclonatronum proteinivorum]
MIWLNPEWLFALLLIPVWLGTEFFWKWRKRKPAFVFTRTDHFGEINPGLRSKALIAVRILKVLAVALIIISLARPQQENVRIDRTTEGIDIVLVIDISSSMLAEDIRPNRFLAVKEVAQNFVRQRSNDRIGVVVFARESITLVPPTLDHRLVQTQLDLLDIGIVRDGTAIGMGVATAANRLRDSEAASRVIVLLTDGENNAGELDPLTSAKIVRSLGMRMYTIGASGEGSAPYPVADPVLVRRYINIPIEIDEPLLITMAEMTGGRYFRARDNRELEDIYAEIDQLETSSFEEDFYIDVRDRYALFLLPGVLLLFTVLLLEKSWLRTEL